MLRKKFTKRQKIYAVIFSGILAALLLVGYIVFLSKGPLSFISFDQMFAITVLIVVMPAGLLDLADSRWKSNADENMPKLVVDIAGYVKSGQHIVKALELAAERNYGVLTPELKKFKAQLSWGIPITKAISSLGERIGTPLAKRIFSLLNHAVTSGGRINELLNTMVKHVSELRTIERERKATLRPYIFTTYIAFLVFLATTILLFSSFFVDLAQTQQTIGGGPFQITLDINVIRSIFYQLSIVEAAIGGLVAGKLGEGTLGSGVKHVVILIFITMIVFTTIV